MGLYTAAIASGSNGNCYYIGNDTEAVLIDAGISCRETERRMKSLSLSMSSVKAIFISHEHGDHIKGLEGLATKHQIPVYITNATLKSSRLQMLHTQTYSFKANEEVRIGRISVTPFSKRHDAADPHSFVVSCNGSHIGVFTDIGMPCENVIRHFNACNVVFLEANYDDEMLEKGNYPYHLKKRIAGGYGHLSNSQALQLLLHHSSPELEHVILSHLSANNNCPELVAMLFKNCTPSTQVTVASRHKATGPYEVGSFSLAPDIMEKYVQASLF